MEFLRGRPYIFVFSQDMSNMRLSSRLNLCLVLPVFVMWSTIHLIVVNCGQGTRSYVPLYTFAGVPLCALDTPSVILSITDDLRIPQVPGSVSCGYQCSMMTGCLCFNYRRPGVQFLSDERCELFLYVPLNCSTAPSGDQSCQHFEVGKGKLQSFSC